MYFVTNYNDFLDEPVSYENLSQAAEKYLKILNQELERLISCQQNNFQRWDDVYFKPWEWKIDCPLYYIKVSHDWNGTDNIDHNIVINSLDKESQIIKNHEDILKHLEKYNLHEVPEMEDLVEQELHPGRALTIANQKAAEESRQMMNKKRTKEILAEPTISCKDRIAKLEHELHKLKESIKEIK